MRIVKTSGIARARGILAPWFAALACGVKKLDRPSDLAVWRAGRAAFRLGQMLLSLRYRLLRSLFRLLLRVGGAIIRSTLVSRPFGLAPNQGSLCPGAAGGSPRTRRHPFEVERKALRVGPRVLNRTRPSRGQSSCPLGNLAPIPSDGPPPRKTPGQRPDLNKCSPHASPDVAVIVNAPSSV
jgi:hypothetical protein